MFWVQQEASFCFLEYFRKFHGRLSAEERTGDAQERRTWQERAQPGPGPGGRTEPGTASRTALQGPTQHGHRETWQGNANGQQSAVTRVLLSSALPPPTLMGSVASEALSFPPGLEISETCTC